MKAICTIYTTLFCFSVFSQSIDTTKAIQNIRKEYNCINSSKDKLEKKSWEVIFKTGFDGIDENGDSIWVEDGSPFQTITTYSDEQGVRLLIVDGGQFEGYKIFYHEEFYLNEGEIFFYYASGGCSMCPDPDNPGGTHLTRITETRIYSFQQKKIRHLTKSYKGGEEEELKEVSRNTPSVDVSDKLEYPRYTTLKKNYGHYLTKKIRR